MQSPIRIQSKQFNRKLSATKVSLLSIPLLFLTCPISNGFPQGYFPDATLAKPIELSQSGKVKFREDWLYSYENGKMSPKGFKIAYDRFDSLGQKIEEANYDLNGKTLLEATYSYDEWGREIQCVGIRNQRNFYHRWHYSFNDSSKTLEKFLTNNNKQRWIYRFDSFGNIREEINFDEDGSVNYTYKINYTKFGKPAELTEYSGTGTMYEKWIYLYNDKFQNIEVMQFDSEGELIKKYLNKYDSMGNRKEVITLDNLDKELERTVSVYQFYK